MNKAKHRIENELKRFIIRLHREIFGKGPKEVWVRINFNTASFYCYEPLTALEEFLLTTEGGDQVVKRIRQTVDHKVKNYIYLELEKITGNKVVDMISKISTEKNCFFGLVHFEKNFE